MVLFSSFGLIFYGQGKGSPHMGKITAHVFVYWLNPIYAVFVHYRGHAKSTSHHLSRDE